MVVFLVVVGRVGRSCKILFVDWLGEKNWVL